MKSKTKTTKSNVGKTTKRRIGKRWRVAVLQDGEWITHTLETSEAAARREKEWIMERDPKLKVKIQAPNPSLERLIACWRSNARRMHKMGAKMSEEGNLAGNEYMQTAATYRLCAKDLASEIRKGS